MNTKLLKILTTLVTVVMIVLMASTVVYGAKITPNLINGTLAPNDKVDTTEIKNFGNKIFNILQAVGAVLSVIILGILGIKYMMGSAEEKADYKKSMIPYVVGAVLIFLAPTIANAIYNML